MLRGAEVLGVGGFLGCSVLWLGATQYCRCPAEMHTLADICVWLHTTAAAGSSTK